MKRVLALLVLFGAGMAEAFAPVPFEVAKALKVTRGKPINSGLVFIDGKYIEPPYVVERYGNVIRINNIQVTGEVIPWSEFLATQKTSKVEPDPSAAPVEDEAPAAAPEPASDASDSDDPLADLFDDAPKTSAKKSTYTIHAVSKPAGPTLKLEGAFVPDDNSRRLVLKINVTRQKIDESLRNGSALFFGSSYARVSCDSGSARVVLQRLPEVMRQHTDVDSFRAAAREAGFVYFPEPLFAELVRNRMDYFKLQQRFKKMEEERKFNSMLQNL